MTTKVVLALVDVDRVNVVGAAVWFVALCCATAFVTNAATVSDEKGDVVLGVASLRASCVRVVFEVAFAAAVSVEEGGMMTLLTPGLGTSTGHRLHTRLEASQYMSTIHRPKLAASRFEMH